MSIGQRESELGQPIVDWHQLQDIEHLTVEDTVSDQTTGVDGHAVPEGDRGALAVVNLVAVQVNRDHVDSV